MTDDARPDSQPDQQVGWQPGGAGYPPHGAPSQQPYDPAQPPPQPPYGAPYPGVPGAGIPAQPPAGQPYPAAAPEQPGWTRSTPPSGMPTVQMTPGPVPQQPAAGAGWSNQPPPVPPLPPVSQPPPVGQSWPAAPRTDTPRPNPQGQAVAPTSAAPAPVSGGPAPQSGAPYSGAPYSSPPQSGAPSSGGPYSGAAYADAPANPTAQGHGAQQAYGAQQGYAAQPGYEAQQGYGAQPAYGAQQGYGTQQGYGAQHGYGAQPYQAPGPSVPDSLPWGPSSPAPSTSGYPGIDSTGQRRIVPSTAEPKRPKFALGLAIGLAVAVLAGGGAFFLGSSTSDGGAKPKPSASTSPSLSRFEAAQQTLNKAKLGGALATLGQPWLSAVGGCVAPGDPGGPTLQQDEKQHVFCRLGGISLNFIAYQTTSARDLNHSVRTQQHVDSATLVPGQQSPTTKAGGVSGTQGDYVEYGFKDQDGRQICGIWWSQVGDSAVLTMETLCQDGLGGDWDVFRDVWQRHS